MAFKSEHNTHSERTWPNRNGPYSTRKKDAFSSKHYEVERKLDANDFLKEYSLYIHKVRKECKAKLS